jgi:hypothetical protein
LIRPGETVRVNACRNCSRHSDTRTSLLPAPSEHSHARAFAQRQRTSRRPESVESRDRTGAVIIPPLPLRHVPGRALRHYDQGGRAVWPTFVLHQAGGASTRRSQRQHLSLTKSEASRSSPENGRYPRGATDRCALRTRPPSTLRTLRTAIDGWDSHTGCPRSLRVRERARDTPSPWAAKPAGLVTRRPMGQADRPAPQCPRHRLFLPRDLTIDALADARERVSNRMPSWSACRQRETRSNLW